VASFVPPYGIDHRFVVSRGHRPLICQNERITERKPAQWTDSLLSPNLIKYDLVYHKMRLNAGAKPVWPFDRSGETEEIIG